MSARRFEARGGAPLEGDVELNARVAIMPREVQTKGYFFGRLVSRIGAGWGGTVKTLEAPPRIGRYLALSDYPSRDYLRLLDAAARASWPGEPTREGHRRLGRGTIEDLSASSIGSAVLKVVGHDVMRALLSFPSAYAGTGKSLRPIQSSALDDGAVRIAFDEPVGGIEYVIGVVEGIVGFFHFTPRADVTWDESRCTLDVRWS